MSELEARLRLLEDRIAIQELTANYNEAWDDGQVDDWLDAFVPDGEFIQKGVPQTKGTESLRKMITAMLAANLIHLTVDHRIDIQGDEARQRARVILGTKSPKRTPGSSEWVTAGSYDDQLRRTGDGWKFVSRTFAPDASLSGLPAWW